MRLISEFKRLSDPSKRGESIFSLKGCQIVAGGRSVVQTTGRQTEMISTLKGWQKTVAPLLGAGERSFRSGGLHYAPTTGYYLAALQAGTHPLPEVVLTSCHHGASLPRDAVAYFFSASA